ncbi:MAG: tetratricopeptide repeat protein [Candidatus Schekmanbacteria bacterium]|nr:tetratricopeptide repeat protein [Candidatus Schekmanbacteria bacterium]
MQYLSRWLILVVCFIFCLVPHAGGKVLDVPDLVLQGNNFFESGQYEKAARSYKEALQLKKSSDAVYNLAITYHHRLDFYAKAMHLYQQFLELEPNSADVPQVKAWLIEVKQKVYPDQAIDPQLKRPEAQELIMTDVGDVNLVSGNQYLLKKEYRKAVSAYMETLTKNNSAAACFNLAVVYDYDLNYWQKAVFFYQKFLSLAPMHEQAGNASGWKVAAEENLKRQKGHFYKGTAFKLRQPKL